MARGGHGLELGRASVVRGPLRGEVARLIPRNDVGPDAADGRSAANTRSGHHGAHFVEILAGGIGLVPEFVRGRGLFHESAVGRGAAIDLVGGFGEGIAPLEADGVRGWFDIAESGARAVGDAVKAVLGKIREYTLLP